MMRKYLFVLPLLFAALILSSCGKKESPRTRVTVKGPENMSCKVSGVALKKNTFAIAPGEYVMEFSAPGYRTAYRKVTVPSSQNFTCDAALERVRASVVISSQPEGATVTLKGHSMGITPLVIRDLEPGAYNAELTMRGFAAVPVSWRIDSERPQYIHKDLESNHGSLVITSAPSRARIIIDGNEVGETPRTISREEGKYVIRIERAGCNPEERNVNIIKGVKGKLHVKLGQKPGGITVATRPAGAELFIDGVKRGVTPCTVEALEPGKYTLKLTHAGFDDLESSVQIIPGAVDKRHFNLARSTGSVVFNVRPAGVEVFLNGKSLGLTRPVTAGSESTQDFRVDNLAPGKYTVTMFHSLGDPQRQSFSFRVKKNQGTTVKSVTMWLANCEITYSDGSTERGFLRDSKPEYVTFSPEPGVQFRVERPKIKKLIMLKETKR